ncbi:MAG: hypothetical protein CMP47_13645 [Rickettsiales bacterium]|nr:hypothetical protein [Rickettsiales bacterium]
MQLLQKQLLTSVCLLALLGCGAKESLTLLDAEPVRTVTKEQIKSNPDLNMGNVLFLLMLGLPIGEPGVSHTSIYEQVRLSKAKIIKESQDIIIAQGFGTDKKTGEEVPVFKVTYQFMNGALFKGPTIEMMPGNSKFKISGSRIEVNN